MVRIWRVHIGGSTFQDLARPLPKENDDIVLWPESGVGRRVEDCIGAMATTHFDNGRCFCQVYQVYQR